MSRIFILAGILFGLVGFVAMGHLVDEPQPTSKELISNPSSKSKSNPIDRSLIAEPVRREYPQSIKLTVRALLREKNFDKLNSVLDNYQQSSESNTPAGADLLIAYRSFFIGDESFKDLLSTWIDETPEKYQPYLARAFYYQGLGSDSRGTAWASETKEEQFEGMRSYYKKSFADIEIVKKLNNLALLPYWLAISMENSLARDENAKLALEAALKIDPASYEIRGQYLHSLTPRWGGSLEKMEAFALESLTYLPENPRLNLLIGKVYKEAGLIKTEERMYNRAEELYSKALSYGEDAFVLENRGYNKYRQEKYQDAISDYDRAIELYLEFPTLFYRRSRAYSELEKYEEALIDIVRAEQLDPYDQRIIDHRKWLVGAMIYKGYQLSKSQNQIAGIKNYNYVLQIDPNNAEGYFYRAQSLAEIGQLELALADVKQSIKLNPNDINAYLLLDWVLAKSRDFGQIVVYWDQYIKLNPTHSRAYLERGGSYYHKGEMKNAVADLKIASDMGNQLAKDFYNKIKHKVE